LSSMIAATWSGKCVTGKLLENKSPSMLEKELEKIRLRKKQKNDAARNERVIEQSKPELDKAKEYGELPYVDVPPLPSVVRSKKTVVVENAQDKNFPNEKEDVAKLMPEPGFKNRAPLQLDERAKDLLQEALKNPISITTEDLLNVSEPMRQELKKLLIKKRLEKKTVMFSSDVDVINGELDDAEQSESEVIYAEKLPAATCEILSEDTDGMVKGSVIVGDPVMQYLNALGPGEKPKPIIVAAESQALRTVYPLINGTGEEEALLDPGSQIVSMAKSVAITLGIAWDPDITVQMQSANRTLERTLGLAKNVSFLFGKITVYLQVHVIENAAYKVLLGRPFDTITESVVMNKKDGSQSLTLTDPNTGERCVMYTHERGKAPSVMKRPMKQDF